MHQTTPTPQTHTLAWVTIDGSLSEVHTATRGEVEEFMRDRLTELSHDLVTRSFHPRYWSVEFHGRILGRSPGQLIAHEMPAATGDLVVDQTAEGATIHFRDGLTGRVWTIAAGPKASTPVGLDRWLTRAGFTPDSPGAGWDFTTDMYGRLVGPARAGVTTHIVQPQQA